MRTKNPHILIALTAVITSFAGIALIALLTNPIVSISYILFFFLLLLIFLIGLAYLLVALRRGKVSVRTRRSIIIVSLILVFLVMFKSSGSLSWIDLIVLLLLGFGLLFYSGRRGM